MLDFLFIPPGKYKVKYQMMKADRQQMYRTPFMQMIGKNRRTIGTLRYVHDGERLVLKGVSLHTPAWRTKHWPILD